METQSAFIWADNIVVLDTVAHVGLHVAFVVYPCDTELNESVGNAKTLDKIALLELRMLVILLFNGSEYLTDSLDILRLIRDSASQLFNIFFLLID